MVVGEALVTNNCPALEGTGRRAQDGQESAYSFLLHRVRDGSGICHAIGPGIAVKERIKLALLLAFVAVWIALGIDPLYRQDWLLENVLVLLVVPMLVIGYRHMPFSLTSCVLIFTFLCLHEIGAHYTYAEVPYDRWLQSLTGHSLNAAMGWERNHFDRLLHFLFGLLITFPMREMLVIHRHQGRAGGTSPG